METNGLTEEKLPQATCPKCGERVASNFRFCPFCGQAMPPAARVAVTPAIPGLSSPVAAPPDETARQNQKNISPEAQRALEEFDRKFEEMKRTRASKPAKLKTSSMADNKAMIAVFAAGMLIFLLILGYFMTNFAKIAQK